MIKQMNRKFILTEIIVLLIVFTACDFLNSNQDFEPTGNSFTLNPNIELIQIQASRVQFNPSGTFSLDFICQSKSPNVETATLPAGLFFLAQNKKVQNTIIVKDYKISASNLVDTFSIGTFSVNEFKAVPGDSDFYNIGPITDHTDLLRIIAIVKGKKLDASNVMTVQHAIYQVTSDDSLGQVMLDSLENLPDSTPPLLAKVKKH
ncbi:MAG: hypothetical protein OEZ20_09780 [candidate division WOR-3 bacterium]|nr:hypothetical protein [candidate division WOR-3 bacterium]MDH5684741.1 hypothetical protein [candidate division WOR-3 bacterium]